MSTMTETKVILDKTNAAGKHVVVVYDGGSCRVSIDGTEVAKDRPRRLTSTQVRQLGLPAEVRAIIGRVSFRHEDTEVIYEAYDRLEAERFAAKYANLPAIEDIRDAYGRLANYDYECERMMERGLIPANPQRDIDSLNDAYPATCLYVRLERILAVTSHSTKAKAYERAMTILESGGSIDEASEITRNWNSTCYND